MIAVPPILHEAVELLAPIRTILKSRGPNIAMMTTRDVDPKLLNRLSHLSELKVRDQMFGGGVIRDAKEVIILLGEEGGGASTLAIWSEHPGLAKFAKSYFTYLWNEAEVYKAENIPKSMFGDHSNMKPFTRADGAKSHNL